MTTQTAAVLAAPAFWPSASPSAYEDLIGYALWPREYGGRFWSHGPGDIVQAMMAPSGDLTTGHGANDRRARITMGSATAAEAKTTDAGAGDACTERAKVQAVQPLDRVSDTINLNAAQRGKLDALRVAVSTAVEREQSACRDDTPGLPPQRLHAVIEGLWSLRYAEFGIRTALQSLYDSLTAEQRQALDSDVQTVGSSAAATNTASPADLCGVRNSPEPNMFAPVERALHPTAEQQTTLQRLHGASMEMAQFLMTTCPAEAPATPMARLDAAGDRVMALLHAAMNIEPLFNDFYGRLTDEQRARVSATLH